MNYKYLSAILLATTLSGFQARVFSESAPETTEAPAELTLTTLNIRDFGAVGDGTHNDAPAFEAALEKVKQTTGPKELFIPNGNYYLLPSEGQKAHVNISREKDLTLRGEENTLLVFGSAFHHGLMVSHSEKVQLNSIAFDFQPLPFTQGTIVEAYPTSDSFLLKLDEGYPRMTDDHMIRGNTKNVLYIYEPGTKRKLNEFHDQYIEKIEPQDETFVKLTSRNPVTKDFVGKKAAMVGRRKAEAVIFNTSNDCTATNLSVHSAPATAYMLQSSTQITLDGCKIIQLPGSNRLMSTNADGLHVKWGEIGPTVLNCHFEGMGDDSINIGGTYQRIYDQLDARTLLVVRHGSLKPGKNIMWVHYQTGKIERLPECTEVGGGRYGELHANKLTFAEDLPADLLTVKQGDMKKSDMVINYDNVPKDSVIRGNFFGRHRMRAILMRSPGAIIEDNRFEDLLGPAIKLGHYYGGRIEGPNGAHCIIRNNTFVNIEQEAISISDWGPIPADQREEPAYAIEEVEIVGNTIEGYGLPSAYGATRDVHVITINNAIDVLLEGNIIGTPHPGAQNRSVPIWIGEAQNVTIRNNQISDKALLKGEWLEISELADRDTVIVESASEK